MIRPSPIPTLTTAFLPDTPLCCASRLLLSAGAVLAAVAVLFLAFGAGSAPLSALLGDSALTARAAAPLVTRRGENRSFRFADGSTAVLDTDSRLEVSFAQATRHLRLAKGRVRLSVTNNEQPLRVEAGGGVVTEIGRAHV